MILGVSLGKSEQSELVIRKKGGEECCFGSKKESNSLRQAAYSDFCMQRESSQATGRRRKEKSENKLL